MLGERCHSRNAGLRASTKQKLQLITELCAGGELFDKPKEEEQLREGGSVEG